MAIDGRDLSRSPDKTDAYESTWIRALSSALVWIPLSLVVVLAYVTGTWIDGVAGGLWSVGGTVLTALGIWAYRKYFTRTKR